MADKTDILLIINLFTSKRQHFSQKKQNIFFISLLVLFFFLPL